MRTKQTDGPCAGPPVPAVPHLLSHALHFHAQHGGGLVDVQVGGVAVAAAAAPEELQQLPHAP